MDQMKEKCAEEIEKTMLENDNNVEASFCSIIRESLYVADDAPGISALERCKKRIALIVWCTHKGLIIHSL